MAQHPYSMYDHRGRQEEMVCLTGLPPQEALDALKDKVLPQLPVGASAEEQREAAWQRVSALVAALLEIAQRQPDRTWGADLEAQVALKSVGIDVEIKR